MDGPSLLPLLIVAVAFVYVVPRVAAAVDGTSDLLAQLFVPPSRTMTWPHGVQEGDEPWAWRSAPLPPSPADFADEDEPTVYELEDVTDVAAVGRHGLVVDLRRVRPERPHQAVAA